MKKCEIYGNSGKPLLPAQEIYCPHKKVYNPETKSVKSKKSVKSCLGRSTQTLYFKTPLDRSTLLLPAVPISTARGKSVQSRIVHFTARTQSPPSHQRSSGISASGVQVNGKHKFSIHTQKLHDIVLRFKK